jgi:hypothetical protein
MREVTHDEVKIRRFLLGDLEEAEREGLEELFLTDLTFRDQVLMVESELIDEYLGGELDQNDANKFRQVFVVPEQLRKLRIARSVRNYAQSELARDVPVFDLTPVPTPTLAPETARRNKAYIYLAIAAALIVIAVGSIWLIRRAQFGQRTAQENNRRSEVEKQLAAANAAATGSIESPEPGVIPLMLASVSTRRPGPRPTLALNSGADAFDLWLVPTTQYQTYNASLTRVDTHDRFDVFGLRLQSEKEAKLIRLRLPAKLFTPGLYEMELKAIGPDGQAVDAGRFTFQLTD